MYKLKLIENSLKMEIFPFKEFFLNFIEMPLLMDWHFAMMKENVIF